MMTRRQVGKVLIATASLICLLALSPPISGISAADSNPALQSTTLKPAQPDVKADGAVKNLTKYQAHITIYDQDGVSVLVEARKKVDQGSDAFDVLRSIVNLEFTTFPKLGPFVTSLAGLKAPDGFFWELTIDGKTSQVGIGDVKIEKNIEIVWKLKAEGGH